MFEKLNIGRKPTMKFHGLFNFSPSQGTQIRPIISDPMTQTDLLSITNELQKIGSIKWKQIFNGGVKLVVNENDRSVQFGRNDYLLKLEKQDGLKVQDELYKFQCSFKSAHGVISSLRTKFEQKIEKYS